MAGFGARLRPHTWSRPKQLIRMADQTVLDHVISTFKTLPDLKNAEYIFIVGYLGEKIEAHMQQTHPDLKVTYVEQAEMRGQSHAIWLAREHLHGPMLMVFADTLIESDLSFLDKEEADAVAWVKAVPDPRRLWRSCRGARWLGDPPDRKAARYQQQPGCGRFLLRSARPRR